MASSSDIPSGVTSTTYFKTGPHHILCKINGVNDSTYPTTTQTAWDDQHVKLPNAQRKYAGEPDYWPEIVQGLSAPILTIRDLTDTMLTWNKKKGPEWNFYILEAFLNGGKPLPLPGGGKAPMAAATINNDEAGSTHADSLEDETQSRSSNEIAQQESLLSDKEGYDLIEDTEENEQGMEENQQGKESETTATAEQILKVPTPPDEGHMYLSNKETIRFFDVVLPRMQQLALRLPELIKTPIPLLMQQQDSAITLSQEQCACLLAHAFFNTFPGRWVPFRHGRRRKWYDRRRKSKKAWQDQEEQPSMSVAGKEDQARGDNNNNHGGKYQRRGQQQKNKPERKQLTLFDYFGKPAPSNAAVTFGSHQQAEGSSTTSISGTDAVKRSACSASDDEAADLMNEMMDIEDEEEGKSSPLEKQGEDDGSQTKLPFRKLPSINFISLFRGEDYKSASSNNVMFAKLRCLFHYFDRVTSDMPQGAVTFHRQVLQQPVDLKGEKRIRTEPFQFSKVTVDLDGPLEDSPLGTLQLDFANKNLGGGALERGAVQEEIRFMICPELILTRLFTEQLQMNEALLIKGCERFSNYNGYSRTFEWHSDHRDAAPRDALGRRQTEICAIDATPFKSRASKLEQFAEYHVWREFNKALVGFRVSPILADDWGLAKAGTGMTYQPTTTLTHRPIATGNWGCGAFGGNVHLKFVLQLLAASVCGAYTANDGRVGHDIMYYAYGLESVGEDIERFMKAVESSQLSINPDRIMHCIVHYPRKNAAGEITGLREKNLLDYLASALGYVKDS